MAKLSSRCLHWVLPSCVSAIDLALQSPGIDINQQFPDGRLPLTTISPQNLRIVIPIPLEIRGIDINAIDAHGNFLLLISCGNPEIFCDIVRHPSLNTNLASPYSGETALMRLACEGKNDQRFFLHCCQGSRSKEIREI
jgi:hypothetical protein